MSDRKPLMAGNWKMHHTHLEAIQVVQKLSYRLDDKDYDARRRRRCAPRSPRCGRCRRRSTATSIPIALGAQNCHWEPQGAFTGEVSPPMLAKLNVQYVIVGHSERRELFGETDEMVAKKVRAVLGAGMTPIVCVGETLDEREAGDTDDKVARPGPRPRSPGCRTTTLARCVVAYEPIWAIGTGKQRHPRRRQRDDRRRSAAALDDGLGGDGGRRMRIQYGGSVKPGNIAELMAMPEIDGGLVGGASLDPDDSPGSSGTPAELGRTDGRGCDRFRERRYAAPLRSGFRRHERGRSVLVNAVLIAIHVIASLILILFVLLHAGRAAACPTCSGASAAASLAGSTVVERNLDRMTVVVALVFMFTTILLSLRLT